jgi:hypothetical protein
MDNFTVLFEQNIRLHLKKTQTILAADIQSAFFVPCNAYENTF